MRPRRTLATTISILALAALAACGKSGVPDTAGSAAGGTVPKTPTYVVHTAANISGSPAWSAAKKRGKIIIGAKADQPFLGFEDLTTNTRSGFDIEIAKMVAADLGFSPDQIQWQTVVSANRETAISQGQVDFYVGTYTINDKRKKLVSFAGPYYQAGQDLLVRSGDTGITGPQSLKGKNVCTATGSTSIDGVKPYGPTITTFDTYSQCVEKLLNGEVDAVTTDDAILRGYAAKNAGKLKVVGVPFSDQPYGIGVAKNDAALRNAIDDALTAHEQNGDWAKAYTATLGLSGSAAPAIPSVQRY